MTSTLLGAGETDRAKPNPCPESADNPEDGADNHQITEHTYHMSGTDGCRCRKKCSEEDSEQLLEKGWGERSTAVLYMTTQTGLSGKTAFGRHGQWESETFRHWRQECSRQKGEDPACSILE